MNKKNVAIYVDYDNLFKRFKEFGLHPIHDVDFFVGLKKKLEKANYNVLKYNAFADFTDKVLSIKDQTEIHSFGVEVYHCSTNNKNTTDAEFIIKVMKDLYTNDHIDVFVIITNDRDFVPLIRAIKEREKITLSLTTKTKVNPVINVFSDYHQYIEDLFELDKLTENEIDINVIETINEDKAKIVSEIFYGSGAFKNLKEKNIQVVLGEYAKSLSRMPKMKATKESKDNIIEYFKAAHSLGFVYLFEHGDIIYIKEGEKYSELMNIEVAFSVQE
jgi:uncharacterized LabA/DUF88 family protein